MQFRQVPLSPAKAVFAGIDVLLGARPFNTDFSQFSSDLWVLQAASGVSSSYEALLDLFECLGSFLKRLDIYTNIPPTPIMTDLIIKIMLELLSVLALATKQIRQGRFSKHVIIYGLFVAQCAIEKFTMKLLGDHDVEAVLQRLNRMTQDEVRIAIAQTLSTVHGLVTNTRVVMEGAQFMFDWSGMFFY